MLSSLSYFTYFYYSQLLSFILFAKSGDFLFTSFAKIGKILKSALVKLRSLLVLPVETTPASPYYHTPSTFFYNRMKAHLEDRNGGFFKMGNDYLTISPSLTTPLLPISRVIFGFLSLSTSFFTTLPLHPYSFSIFHEKYTAYVKSTMELSSIKKTHVFNHSLKEVNATTPFNINIKSGSEGVRLF